MLYASRTGTRSTIASLDAHGWRILVSATGEHRNEGLPYALDNGAWTSHQRKSGLLDLNLYTQLVTTHGAAADWCVLPDAVGGGALSLSLSLLWRDWTLARVPRVLIAVQDGMTERDVARHLGSTVGVFVGGSTEWKERTAGAWGRLCRSRGAHLHVGRVNTRRRIRIAAEAGADSIDGTSAILFPVNIPKITRWRDEEVKRANDCPALWRH